MFRSGTNPPEPNQPEPLDLTPGYSASQSSESYTSVSAESVSPPKTVAESATIAREINEGTFSAFVGNGMAITGQVSFKSMLRVDGHFSGRIFSEEGTLMVAAGGRVDANVAVAVARIHGVLTGDIIATDRIELGRSAKVTGNIHAPSLIVEPGAVWDGTCRMGPVEAGSEPEAISEPEEKAAVEAVIVPKLETTPQPEIVAAPEVASAPEIVSAQVAQSQPEAAAEQKAAAEPEKPPKVERKENVLGNRTRRARAKAANTKAAGDEPAANAMAG